MNVTQAIAISFLLPTLLTCKNGDTEPVVSPEFMVPTTGQSLDTDTIAEVSGMVASPTMQQQFWVHNDSGDENRVFLINNQAHYKATCYLQGAKNRDWEDMSSMGGYLYVADIGDNNAVYDSYTIYRAKEPTISESLLPKIYVIDAEKITFRYEDGSHDAEAFLIDVLTKDILLITKRDPQARVYRLAYPQSFTSTNTATFVGTLPFTLCTAACVSSNGEDVLLKTYTQVFYWKRKDKEALSETLTLKRIPIEIPYKIEPQGEAIAYQESDFYTLSEGSKPVLYQYRRIK